MEGSCWLNKYCWYNKKDQQNPNALKLYTKFLKKIQSPFNPDKTVEDFDQELLDNNEKFNNGVFYINSKS